MTVESLATLIVALAVTGAWGLYCYVLGRKTGQSDLVGDLLEFDIVRVDPDGMLIPGKGGRRPPADHGNDPPSAPAV